MTCHRTKYYSEAIADALHDLDIESTTSQVEYIAEAVVGYMEHESLAFYSPPSSERINAIESEWKKKYEDLQKLMDERIEAHETAIKRAYKIGKDSDISVDKYGFTTKHR